MKKFSQGHWRFTWSFWIPSGLLEVYLINFKVPVGLVKVNTQDIHGYKKKKKIGK